MCVDTNVLNKLRTIAADNGAYYPYNSSNANNRKIKSRYIATVEKNEAKYTRQQVARARRARELMQILYHPSDESLIRTLVHGVMINCKVTPDDVRLATKIYGRSAPFVMGRAKAPPPISNHEINVPTSLQKEQALYADILAWREIPFLLFIVKPLKLLMVQWLPKGHNTAALVEVFETMINNLKQREFHITIAHVDPASILTSLDKKLSVRINDIGTAMHVADAEVEIKILKEILRSSESGLPFPVPLRFVKAHVYGAVGYRNTVLRRGETCSPREKYSGVKFDVSKHARAKFMCYCLAYRSPSESNSNEKRASSSLFLLHTGNASGTVIMYDLITKATFRCDKFTVEPMPELVVRIIRKMAEEDEPKNLRKRPPAWMLTRAMEHYESQAVDNIDNDPHVRELIAVPHERNEPPNAVYLDADVEVGPPAPQEASGDTNAVAAYDASDNGVTNKESQALGSSQGNAATRSDAAHTGYADYESEDDDTHDDGQGRFSRDLIDAYPKVVDETIENYDPNYHTKDGRRVSKRRQERLLAHAVRAYKMSLKKALSSNKPGVEEAITGELKQLVDKKVWSYVKKADLSKSQRRSLIRSHMFMKDKYKSTGAFEKWKARLVAGGDTQDKSIYDDLSSPTVSLDSVFTIIAIAASERRHICTIDITGAYLECELPPGDDVYMVIDPLVCKILRKLDPSAKQFVADNGEVVVKLTRALYGCVQSALLWFKKLKSTLEEAGFEANPYDQCVFNKMVNGKQVTVAFHVDDLLVTSQSMEAIDYLIQFLESKFTAVTAEKGDKHSYLAMTIETNRRHYTVSMHGYITTLLKDRKTRVVVSPATDALFEEEDDPELLSEEDKKIFHSDVAKLLFLAKRVKMTCLTAVSALASKVAAPTVEDKKKLDRVFNYVATSRDQIMKFKVGGDINPVAFVDASHATQPGRKSRTGILLKIAGCAIGVWSVKQKLVTKSSTEAELVALTEALTNIIWLRRFYEYQGYRDMPPTVVWEDNESCINLIKNPRHNKQRTRHLDIRYFYARELQEQGMIQLKYVKTEDQEADLLTKGMVNNFNTLADRLTGNAI